MKRLLATLLALVLFTASAGAADLYVDTEKITTDTPPTIVDGRIMVPLRAIFEALGASVEWDQATKTATGVRGGTTVVIQIDNATAYKNGEAKTLDVPAQLINGRTMVPARFISESLGCDVTWHQDSKTAAVADKLIGQKIYVTETGKKYHYNGTCNGGTYYEATLAEADGRGLEPCDKCVLTSASVPSTPTTVETVGQKNALRSAKSYLDLMAFSHGGLVNQLMYEGYSADDATYAADNCGANWSEQALKSAKSYLDLMAFSRQGLIEQLEHDKYTTEQATYGADNSGADWYEQAVLSAKSYLDLMAFSRDGLIDQLEYDGYTYEQAVYGAEQNGY